MIRSKLKELLKLSSIYSFGHMLERLLGFVLIPLYTTYLTTGDYGLYAIMSVTVSLIIPFIDTPFTLGLGRYYYNPEYISKNKEIFFNGVIFIFLQSIIISILFYFGSTFFSKAILGDPEKYYIVKIYAIILIFQPFKESLNSLIRLKKMAKLYVTLSISRLILSACLIIYLLVVLKLGILALIYGTLFGVIYDIIFLLPFFIRNIKPKLNYKILKPVISYGYPLIVSSISMYLMQANNRYFLRIFANISAVGLFSFGNKFGSLVNEFFITPTKRSIGPIIFESEKEGNVWKELVKRYSIYFYIVAMFICLMISMFSRDLIRLMARNEEFWSAWVIVPIISFSCVLFGLRGLFETGVVMAKKSNIIAQNYAFSAIFNIIFNILLIPKFGIIGAAMSTLITYLILCIIGIYYSYKYSKLTFDYNKLIKITILGLSIYLLSILINFKIFYARLAYYSILLALYIFLIYLSKILTNNEKIFLFRYFKRLRNRDYLISLKDIFINDKNVLS